MKRSRRPARAVRSRIATGHGVADSGGLGQVLGDRVVRAEHPAAAPQGVLAQRAGRLDLAEQGQGDGQGGGRTESDRVVRAEDPAAALLRVLTTARAASTSPS